MNIEIELTQGETLHDIASNIIICLKIKKLSKDSCPLPKVMVEAGFACSVRKILKLFAQFKA